MMVKSVGFYRGTCPDFTLGGMEQIHIMLSIYRGVKEEMQGGPQRNTKYSAFLCVSSL